MAATANGCTAKKSKTAAAGLASRHGEAHGQQAPAALPPMTVEVLGGQVSAEQTALSLSTPSKKVEIGALLAGAELAASHRDWRIECLSTLDVTRCTPVASGCPLACRRATELR